MSGSTSRLGLYLPGGGSTAQYGSDEAADVDKLNDNFKKLDSLYAGVGAAAFAGLPAGLFRGQLGFTSSDNMVWKWAVPVGGGSPIWRPWESDWIGADNFGYQGPNVAPYQRVARYRYRSGRVLYEGIMTLNGGPMGTDLVIGLPVQADNYQLVTLIGRCLMKDASDSYRAYTGTVAYRDPNTVTIACHNPGDTSRPEVLVGVVGSKPFNADWAQSDQIDFSIEYDPAS